MVEHKHFYNPEFDPVERLGEADPDYMEKWKHDLETLEDFNPTAPEEHADYYEPKWLDDLLEEEQERPVERYIELKTY